MENAKIEDENEKDPLVKTFTGVLMLNWRNGEWRVRQTEPKKSDIKPQEIPIRLSITVRMPQAPELKLTGDVTVPKYKVNEIMLDNL